MDLHTRYTSITREDIERFVSDAQEEHLTLDFKSIQNAALKRPDDKRSIARSLSGFANSEGGLIIWGVDARKNDRGIDAATALSPITELDRLVPRLNELTGEATSPVVEGVRHRPIDIGDNAGFGVTYVPESETGPHMARLGENRYYKRSGDSFYVMEHFDVQDMFGRRKQPKLELSIRITGTGSQTVIYLGIQNNGRGTARAPYLAFTIPAPFQHNMYGLDGNMHEGLPRLLGKGAGGFIRYGGGTSTVIHPESTLEVAAIYLGLGGQGPSPPKEGVTVDFEITAEDTRMVRGSQKITFE